MLPDWRLSLRDAGAVFSDEKLLHFGHPVAESRNAMDGSVIADLSHLALISVIGKDAEKFLQGQFTNDVRNVTGQRSQLSAWCSIKGRMIASFRVFVRSNSYYIQLPSELFESTLRRLRMFVLRSDVQLADASDSVVRIGLSGKDTVSRLKDGWATPSAVDDVIHTDTLTIIRLRGIKPRFEAIGPVGSIKALWLSLTEDTSPVGPSAWELLDILAGVPTIYPETSDKFLPQNVNFQVIDGVSFAKGCYTGQEVVARTQHLGKLKRRMYLAHVDAPVAPKPKDPLYVSYPNGSQIAGTIVNVQAHPDGGWKMLAVIQSQAAYENVLHLGNQGGPGVRLETLPYSIEGE